MRDPIENKSMLLFGSTGKTLLTQALAVMMAESIIQTAYGDAELEAQRPLVAIETPATRVIEGSRAYDDDRDPESQMIDGRVVIEIMKRNCQVIRLSKMVDIVMR